MKVLGILGMTMTLVLVGCSAPRGLGHTPSVPSPVVDPEQSEVESTFAKEAGELTIGSVAFFAKTPVGYSQVRALSRYVNGLSETCTKVEMKTQSGSALAGLCQDKDGVWRYVPLSD